MAKKTTMLIAGEAQPREVFITRVIAIRVFCECFKHAQRRRRDSWVFLLALDRDDVKTYVRRADSPDAAPWRSVDMNGPLELEVCGTRLTLTDQVDSGGAILDDQEILDAEHVPAPWWNDGRVEDPNVARERDLAIAQEEFDRKKREGLIDDYDADKPKEGYAARRKRKARELAHAQPNLIDPSQGDEER